MKYSLFFERQIENMSLWKGCDLHLMSTFPPSLHEYVNSYILINKQLHYVKGNGKSKTVTIDDFEKFSKMLEDLNKNKASKIHLSSEQLNQAIILNGDQWKNNLIAAGCNKEVLNKVTSAQAIQDYKKLYQAVLEMPSRVRPFLHSWELYCLSGKPLAIEYAIQEEGLTSDTKNRWGDNALHMAAWGGSVPVMKYCIEVLKVDPTSLNHEGTNVLHFAVWSGSVEAVRFVRQLSDKQDLKLDPTVRNEAGEDAFFFARLLQHNPAFIIEELNTLSQKRLAF